MKPQDIFRFCPKCGSNDFKYNGSYFLCGSCHLIRYINPVPAVTAIIREDDRILCTERAYEPHKGKLGFPGGFIDENETAQSALVREVKEEINLDVTKSQFIFSAPNTYEYGGITISTLGFAFFCDVKDLSCIKVADDVASYKWISIDDLDEEDFAFNEHVLLVRYFKENR